MTNILKSWLRRLSCLLLSSEAQQTSMTQHNLTSRLVHLSLCKLSEITHCIMPLPSQGVLPWRMMRKSTAKQADNVLNVIDVDSAFPRHWHWHWQCQQRDTECLKGDAMQRQMQVGLGLRAETYVRFLSPESNHLLTFSHYRRHSCSKAPLTILCLVSLS